MEDKDRCSHCKICNKYYASYKSLWNHNNKFHSNIENDSKESDKKNQEILKKSQEKLSCIFCNKLFSFKQSKYDHQKNYCKLRKNITNDLEDDKIKLQVKKEETKILKLKLKLELSNQKEENQKLKEELKNINILKINKDIEDIKKNINNPPINNQLIDIISSKNKKIEELEQNKNQPIIDRQINTFESLTLNNIIITSRSDDNYINATQLCQAGGKIFSHWYSLDSTKRFINEVECDMGIPVLQLVDINIDNQDIWIHPDLAIQLAQWISPKFIIQVSKWIGKLYTNNKVEITEKLLIENKLKDEEIKLLKDTYLKKHKREDYPDKNVIYLITTNDHLKNRIYIIGKAKDLKKRLSTYNKTCDHQVIYYKKCINEEILNLVELMTLKILKKYQEKANRDRFILPVENDISLFINTIENCINFYDKYY